MNNLQLNDNDLAIVKNILKQNLPNLTVFAFGSRTKMTAKPYSDLDLVVMTDTLLDLATMASLKDDFAESDLVFKVDISDWASLSDEFKSRIQSDLIQI